MSTDRSRILHNAPLSHTHSHTHTSAPVGVTEVARGRIIIVTCFRTVVVHRRDMSCAGVTVARDGSCSCHLVDCKHLTLNVFADSGTQARHESSTRDCSCNVFMHDNY